MPTSKLLRAAPPHNLNDYVVSIKRLNSNPESIDDSIFLERNFVAPGDNPLTEDAADDVNVNLGFTLEINEIKYSRVAISAAGWLLLVSPQGFLASPWYHDVIESPWDITSNHKILINPAWNREHILIAPWFDHILPFARSVDILDSTGWFSTLTSVVKDFIKEGIFWPGTPPIPSITSTVGSLPFSKTDRGVRYSRGYDKNFGRYFLCRWTASAAPYYTGPKIKFEAVIYENGKIEFRYWQKENIVEADSHPLVLLKGATTGIFWYRREGTQFRDCAPLLDYNKTLRSILPLGGSENNDPGYSENSKPYSNEINYNSNWPGPGVITFTPPGNVYKVLPRKNVREVVESKNIVRKPGLFDDRKTINFTGSINVLYPSTLPTRLQGDTGNIDVSMRQLFFTTGSIEARGDVNKAAVDSFLEQLEGTSHTLIRSDNSFNEDQKDYRITNQLNNPFFATGSSIEKFGLGFSGPLKSKTQFHFSLPIKQQVILPPVSSSLHYYNKNRQSWDLKDIQVRRDPEAISIDKTLLGLSPVFYECEDDDQFYYRVSETSTAFDAVGRKIVAGDRRNNKATGNFSESTYQRDSVIGAIYNKSSSKFLDGILEKEYPSSFTDYLEFNPADDNKIYLPIDEPFLIEKIIIEFPFYAEGEWFEDRTTCVRPRIDRGDPPSVLAVEQQRPYAGFIDFGGPGITVAVTCARKSLDFFQQDIIASGTFTHHLDGPTPSTRKVIFRKNENGFAPFESYWTLRPEGFSHFSNPSFIVGGIWNGSQYTFDGNVRLDMASSVSSGIIFARNERSPDRSSMPFFNSNGNFARAIMTENKIGINGEDGHSSTFEYNTKDINHVDITEYEERSPRIYIQQVSPLSRGSTGVNFSGNSILGGTISTNKTQTEFRNPLFVSDASVFDSTPQGSQIISAPSDFRFDAVSIYSNFESKPSPYLLYPKDGLSIVISKTRPVVFLYGEDKNEDYPDYFHHEGYILTGSHNTVTLNTGSIEITVYGSYVKEAAEYHP